MEQHEALEIALDTIREMAADGLDEATQERLFGAAEQVAAKAASEYDDWDEAADWIADELDRMAGETS